jgi:uncharacterized membrane protein YhaH (DUF805 family)
MNWYMEVLRKYAQFDGRARRKEYWMFTLVNLLVSFAIALVGAMIGGMIARGSDNPSIVMMFVAPAWLYCLVMIIPSLSVAVRRLHDTGRSGWWILIGLVPFVGGIILLVFYCLDSQPGPNEYGPNPKEIQAYGQIPPPVPGY